MVGPNTMLAATPWIKKNMLGIDSEQEIKNPTEAEMRVKRCAENLEVPDWYRNYFKPDTKFLKDKTPFECRPPSWKSMNGKVAAGKPVKKSRTPKKEPPPPKQQLPNDKKNDETMAKTRAQPSPRKSLNSNYRINRKADRSTKSKARLSISITPSSSDNELDQQPVAHSSDNEDEEATLVNLSKSLNCPLNASNTFPRVQPSRKIENINIVFAQDFTAKPPRRQLQTPKDEPEESNECLAASSTPRTHYTLTKNIDMSESTYDDCSNATSIPSSSAELSQKSSYTSFLLAEVEPCGTSTTMQMFAGLDSDESDERELPARCSPSPHTRFFNSEKKSIELERIVQNSKEIKRGNNLIREIIDELDRSIADRSVAGSRRSQGNEDEEFNASQNFVKNVVRALEDVNSKSRDDQDGDDEDDEERSYEEDSDLAKSTSISLKSYGDGATSSNDDNDDDDDGHGQESTPIPTYQNYQQQLEDKEQKEEEEEDKEEEIYWIPVKNRDLARTSSRLSMMSRESSRLGFQCTSGRCSPGLSPIKTDRARDEWSTTLSSYRSQMKSRQQLFRIDETGVADSGCYSDRSGATSQSTRTPAFSENTSSPSPIYSLTPSPTLTNANNQFPSSNSSSLSSLSTSPTDFDRITADMLIKMSPPFVQLKSVRV